MIATNVATPGPAPKLASAMLAARRHETKAKTPMYCDVQLQIDGTWRAGGNGEAKPVVNPATEEAIGSYACASEADLGEAVAAARRGFAEWSSLSPFARSAIMRKAAGLLRERADAISRTMTLEQGKPLREAMTETLAAADTIDWFAEEGRRTYGRVVPARTPHTRQLVVREPIGPVAAFTPWNFPINQAVRKLAAALATGCSVILKGPEDTPASCAELVKALIDAGVPGNVVQLVFGHPPTISSYLISHPDIRKITFTGSTEVGKQLASLAGAHMKRITMELGGHAPAIIFKDADIDKAVAVLSTNKFRNAGQVCVSPTRFLVHHSVVDEFTEKFVGAASKIKVGDGLDPATTMGPLIHERRLAAVGALVDEAQRQGATLALGGQRLGNRGFFFEPTVLTQVPVASRMMREEPFGPVAAINSFTEVEEALQEANRLPFGLAAYAYTASLETADKVGSTVAAGMVAINHHGLGHPETPFGGINDSGYGSEGGSEALEGYLNTKFVTQSAA